MRQRHSQPEGEHGWLLKWIALGLLAAVPLLIGTHIFGRTILDSLAPPSLTLSAFHSAWAASDQASQSLARSAWVSAVCFLAFVAMSILSTMRTVRSARRRSPFLSALLSASFLFVASLIVWKTSSLAAENASPWPRQVSHSDRSFVTNPASGSLFEMLQGPCPSPYLSAPAVEILSPFLRDSAKSLPIRVVGANQASSIGQLRDDLAAALNNAELLSYESPHQLNVFANPQSPSSELVTAAAMAYAVGFRQISLVCGTEETANRPLLGLRKRIRASSIMLDMVPGEGAESDDVVSTKAFRTVGELASHSSTSSRRKTLLVGKRVGQ